VLLCPCSLHAKAPYQASASDTTYERKYRLHWHNVIRYFFTQVCIMNGSILVTSDMNGCIVLHILNEHQKWPDDFCDTVLNA
jgi:hypothetical protein